MIRGSAFQELDDAGLVSKCVAWDDGAWDAFVTRHASFIEAEARRQLYRYQGQAAASDIEDACQEVYSLLMKDGARTLRQFRHEASLSTWLACIVRSVCRQSVRRDRVTGYPAEEIPVSPPVAEHVSPEALNEALSRLPGRDQRLLRLFFAEGKKYREIAHDLGLSINSVGPLLTRAIASAKRLLAR